MSGAIFVRGMKGLGDCIFSRAFIKALARRADVYYETPWPEIVYDLPRVRFVYSRTPLRTQARNVAQQPPSRWSQAPDRIAQRITIGYGAAELRSGSILQTMERQTGVAPESWDLPAFPRWPATDRPLAVVRPVTERAEWLNAGRSPRPQYVDFVARDLMRTHHVVSVADVVDGVEWFVGDPPSAHERYHKGELGVRELLGLIQSADVVVGGVGWILPACIAASVPLFCILGGNGAHNHPRLITDRRMDLSRIRFAMPDRFCLCENMGRRGAVCCDKTISNIDAQWSAFRRECLAAAEPVPA
jgi:hypothetical protein